MSTMLDVLVKDRTKKHKDIQRFKTALAVYKGVASGVDLETLLEEYDMGTGQYHVAIVELRKAAKENMTIEGYVAKGRPFKYGSKVLAKVRK